MTYLGVMSRIDGCLCCNGSCPNGTPTQIVDDQQRQVFQLNTGGQGLIVVEGGAGLGQATPGTSLQPGPPDNRPDLQIETTQAMGNGSAAVCDIGPTSAGGGGVFPISTPDFTLDSLGATPGTISGALADFACRFEYHPAGALCTYFGDTASQSYLGAGSVVQFCDVIAANAEFLPGESIVTVRLRDINGSTGPTAQIVVLVSTPTPTPGP